MPRKPRKRPRSSKIGLPDSDQWTSCSLAGRTTTSEKGKRADRWKPSVLRSSIDVRGVGVDRQQVGELAAEQLFRLALEIVGELLRDVGQGAERIGFPEPAAAAVFELVDEMQRLARLRFELEPLAPGGDDAARSGDAVGDQHQRQDRDARGISGELASTTAAPTETTMLTSASGGELIETIVRMAMPAAMADRRGGDRRDELHRRRRSQPNQVHSSPASDEIDARAPGSPCAARS